MIATETVEAVRMRTDIVALVSESVRLKPHGDARQPYFSGPCPFCGCVLDDDEQYRLPAFLVYPGHRPADCACNRLHHGTFHCFGDCEEGGDAIDFVSKHDGVTWLEAVDRLAARAGIEVKWQRMVTVDVFVPRPRPLRRRFPRLPAVEGGREATNTWQKFGRRTGSRP